jgi:peptide/nickel transport system permease protein/oligopeptide transport system permease protein
MSAADIARLDEQWGLSDPIHVQFGRFVVDAVQGDFGRSVWSRRPVTTQISQQISATAELAAASMFVALIIGFPLGVLAALRKDSLIDTFSMSIALLGVSMPNFWLGLILIMFFGAHLGWFPMAGAGSLEHLVLPALTLGFSLSGIIARLVRSAMLEALSQDFIRTARSKGLIERVVAWKHALRNALIPVVTVLGLQVAGLLNGAVVVETVFGRPGIGRMLVNGIIEKDFPVVQGVVILVAAVYVVANIIVDVLYAAIDPRIQYA